jgi:hypothetical protein
LVCRDAWSTSLSPKAEWNQSAQRPTQSHKVLVYQKTSRTQKHLRRELLIFLPSRRSLYKKKQSGRQQQQANSLVILHYNAFL